MDKPLAPIFIIDGSDIGVYGSIRDVQLDLEAIDVETGGLRACDAEGRLLRLEVDGGQVTVLPAEEQPQHSIEVEAALRNFLKASNQPIADDPACDLACLVNACRKFMSPTPTVSTLFKTALRNLASTFHKQ